VAGRRHLNIEDNDLRSGDPGFIDKLVALTFGNMAYDAILDGKSGLMSGMVQGCYDLVPIPDPKLGPRKVDVATMYNTERYRQIYANKRGLPIFLNPHRRGGGRPHAPCRDCIRLRLIPIASIAADDALIQPHRVDLLGRNFRERQGST
jgi:hypothetical protein